MPKSRTLNILAGVVFSFSGLAATIIYLLAADKITNGVAILMLIALVGLYFGFGILIAVYRLISKLD